MSRTIQTSSIGAQGKLIIGTGCGCARDAAMAGSGSWDAALAATWRMRVGCSPAPKKNGSLSEDKLPLRLCWGNCPLAISAAACSASGFRAKCVDSWGFSASLFAQCRFGFPTRIWSSCLMIFVRLIRSGLRLPVSGFLRSSIQRPISLSGEKQINRLDHLPGPGLSCGSLLTGRWFVRFPSDNLYMTLQPESLLAENSKLSTGSPVSGGQLLRMRWIISDLIGISDRMPAGPTLPLGGDGEEPDLWTNPGAAIGRRVRRPGL